MPIDIDDAPEYYIWTVSEGAMDYDIYEELNRGKSCEILRKVTVIAGDLEAVFDMNIPRQFEQFMAHLKQDRY